MLTGVVTTDRCPCQALPAAARWLRESVSSQAPWRGPSACPRIGCRLGREIGGNAIEEEEPDVTVRIAVLDDPPQRPDNHLQPGLFPAFPGRGLGRRFAGLALAARELPEAGVNRSLRPAADQVVAAAANQADANVDQTGCAGSAGSWARPERFRGGDQGGRQEGSHRFGLSVA